MARVRARIACSAGDGVAGRRSRLHTEPTCSSVQTRREALPFLASRTLQHPSAPTILPTLHLSGTRCVWDKVRQGTTRRESRSDGDEGKLRSGVARREQPTGRRCAGYAVFGPRTPARARDHREGPLMAALRRREAEASAGGRALRERERESEAPRVPSAGGGRWDVRQVRRRECARRERIRFRAADHSMDASPVAVAYTPVVRCRSVHKHRQRARARAGAFSPSRRSPRAAVHGIHRRGRSSLCAAIAPAGPGRGGVGVQRISRAQDRSACRQGVRNRHGNPVIERVARCGAR